MVFWISFTGQDLHPRILKSDPHPWILADIYYRTWPLKKKRWGSSGKTLPYNISFILVGMFRGHFVREMVKIVREGVKIVRLVVKNVRKIWYLGKIYTPPSRLKELYSCSSGWLNQNMVSQSWTGKWKIFL